MAAVTVSVTINDAAVTGPFGSGCGFKLVSVGGATLAAGPVERPHPGRNREAARAAVPCMTLRRVRTEDSKSECTMSISRTKQLRASLDNDAQ